MEQLQTTLPRRPTAGTRTTYLSLGELERFRQRLLDERQLVLEEIERLREAMHNDGEHLADEPDRRHQQVEEDHSITASLLYREQEHFEAIERALERIDRRTYGVCVETNRLIPLARLEAVPWAERVLESQARLESVLAR